jgi:hypothetical protein
MGIDMEVTQKIFKSLDTSLLRGHASDGIVGVRS